MRIRLAIRAYRALAGYVVQYKLRRSYRAEVVVVEPWRPLEGTLIHVTGVQVGAWHWSQASPVTSIINFKRNCEENL